MSRVSRLVIAVVLLACVCPLGGCGGFWDSYDVKPSPGGSSPY